MNFFLSKNIRCGNIAACDCQFPNTSIIGNRILMLNKKGAVLEVSVMLILKQVQDDSFSIYAICSVEIPKRVRNDTAN